MSRSLRAKADQLSDEVLDAAARARARCLALIHGALSATGLDQVELARRLGVKKSAVNAVLRGNGNIRMNTLAEYMAVLGYEIDFVAVKAGELERARDARRAPRHECLTIADEDREPPGAALALPLLVAENHRDWWLSNLASFDFHDDNFDVKVEGRPHAPRVTSDTYLQALASA